MKSDFFETGYCVNNDGSLHTVTVPEVNNYGTSGPSGTSGIPGKNGSMGHMNSYSEQNDSSWYHRNSKSGIISNPPNTCTPIIYGYTTSSLSVVETEVKNFILEYGPFEYDFIDDIENTGIIYLKPNTMKYLISELRQNESLVFVLRYDKWVDIPSTIFWDNPNVKYSGIRLLKNEPVKRYLEKVRMLQLRDEILNYTKEIKEIY